MAAEHAYPIVEVPAAASTQLEQLGTKAKFWFRDEADQVVLFKEGRPGTGENWAEKIACELASLLGLPHAHYHLAKSGERNGVVTPSFVPQLGRLVHGNEALGRIHTDYDQTSRYRGKQHLLGRIHAVLRQDSIALPNGWERRESLQTAFDIFLGYLMLDALVGNQDRHHENWGFVVTHGEVALAPSFDHASSMGRNESDEQRQARLTTLDQGFSVAAYAARARSAIYRSVSDSKPMTTLECFVAAARKTPNAGSYWIRRLKDLHLESIQDCLDQLPSEAASEIARSFAFELLKSNRKRLLSLELC